MINNPNQYHVEKLLNILELLQYDKKQAMEKRNIHRQSYKDLFSLVLGVVGTSNIFERRYFLNNDSEKSGNR